MKVWVRYCVVMAHLHPVIMSFFTDLANFLEQLDIEDVSVDDIQIHYGWSFFNFEDCMFKITEIGNVFAIAEAIQSKKCNYICRKAYCFNDLNVIKQSIKDMMYNTN